MTLGACISLVTSDLDECQISNSVTLMPRQFKLPNCRHLGQMAFSFKISATARSASGWSTSDNLRR